MAIKIGWNDGHTITGLGTGAIGYIKETDRNRRIGAKARNILSNEYEGVTIVNCTIDRSENDMGEAVNIANSNDCDVFISNHVNAGGGVGFETFYSRKSTQSNINRAHVIHKHLVATNSCLASRRCTTDFSYKGYDFYVLINTKMEAMLFEIGFVDNQTCVNAVNDDEVARAYAEGIADAYDIKKKNNTITPPPKPFESPLIYQAHVQEIGWQDDKTNDEIAGTTGQSLRLEALTISYPNVKFRGHIENLGWTGWRESGEVMGTIGKSLRLEAIEIQSDKLEFSVHVQDIGWTNYGRNCVLGTTGQSKRIEAIKIREI